MGVVDVFSTGQFYHLYNKSLDSLTPFLDDRYAYHMLKLAWFYRSTDNKVSYSLFNNSPVDLRARLSNNINNSLSFQVEILSHCLMDNHYHFLLRQNKDYGISRFMNNIINAFTRYYNISINRKGPIFLPRYKSRIVHTEEQLIHLSRYIHLNPYSSGKVESFKELCQYRFSSLYEYLSQPKLVNTSYVLKSGYFLGNKTKYKSFITNHADYQRSLEFFKYIEKWK